MPKTPLGTIQHTDTVNNTTEQVLTHHLVAFGNNNLDEILKDYTDDSVILTADGIITGLAAIRSFFESFFAVIPTGSSFGMDQKIVVGNIAYIVWHSETNALNFPLRTDTFVFEGDKIKYHTVADYRINK